MSLWVWILIVSGALLAVSLLVGLGLAAILGVVSREVSGLLELEEWTDAPLMDERLAEEELDSAPPAASRRGRTHA
jgi:hypothetical protein